MNETQCKSIAVFRGSPRRDGNTNTLANVFTSKLRENRCRVQDLDLCAMDIRPCIACRMCQREWKDVTCAQQDDMKRVFDAVMGSQLLVLATPIYAWYCTPPMKSMLDRLVYAMNMYYGDRKGPSLWEGKSMALIVTCGYPAEKGADLFEEGMKRYCRHSKLVYTGMLCEQHLGYDTEFMDQDKRTRISEFAEECIRLM